MKPKISLAISKAIQISRSEEKKVRNEVGKGFCLGLIPRAPSLD